MFRYQEAGSEFEILLVTSRGSRRWVIPQGWSMKGKKPYQAAASEAWEEAGVRGRVKQEPVGRYTYPRELDNGGVMPCIVELARIAALPAADRAWFRRLYSPGWRRSEAGRGKRQ